MRCSNVISALFGLTSRLHSFVVADIRSPDSFDKLEMLRDGRGRGLNLGLPHMVFIVERSIPQTSVRSTEMPNEYLH